MNIVNCVKSIVYKSFTALGVVSIIGGLATGVLMLSVCKNESERRRREEEQYREEKQK